MTILLSESTTSQRSGRTVTTRGTIRIQMFLVGRDVVLVTALGGTATATGTSVVTVLVDDAPTRALGLRAARASVAKLR